MNAFPACEAIAAILPQYQTSGDSVVIITRDGSQATYCSRLRTIIRQLARSRTTDLARLKETSSSTTSRRILVPLPLAPGLVLFPVKIRIPRVAGDSSVGYISLHAVQSIQPASSPPHKCTVMLSSGAAVPVLWTQATVGRSMQSARLAEMSAPHRLSIVTLMESPAAYGPAGFRSILLQLVSGLLDIIEQKQNL